MDDDQQFCLRWNNHQSTLISVFDTLLENETLVDCTLAAEGKFLKAHKVVLSACSPYFAALLQEQYDKHPIFILKDVKYQELRAMMDYMYRGEVNISQDQLAALLKAAESLQIKGLSDNRSGNAPKPEQQQHHRGLGVPVGGMAGKLSGGYTLEQTKRARVGPTSMDSQEMLTGSREGSSSPSRRRRKVRRRSIENTMAEVHDSSNSSQIQAAANQQSTLLLQQQQQQQQQSNSSLTGVGAITAAASALAAVNQGMPITTASSAAGGIATAGPGTNQQMTTSVTKKTDSAKGTSDAMNTDNVQAGSIVGDEQQQQQEMLEQHATVGGKSEKQNHKQKSGAAKESGGGVGTASAELVIEPKSEYDDEGNDEAVEDLTLDDEDIGMDDLDHNAGTSQGAEGSSQGYAPWQHDRSQDELLLATQEAQQRDPQDMKYDFQTSMTVGDHLTERFPCYVCGKSYLRKRHLQRHRRDECIGIPPRFSCDMCPSQFRRKYHMVRHLISKHDVPPAIAQLTTSNAVRGAAGGAGAGNSSNASSTFSEFDGTIPENLSMKKEHYEVAAAAYLDGQAGTANGGGGIMDGKATGQQCVGVGSAASETSCGRDHNDDDDDDDDNGTEEGGSVTPPPPLQIPTYGLTGAITAISAAAAVVEDQHMKQLQEQLQLKQERHVAGAEALGDLSVAANVAAGVTIQAAEPGMAAAGYLGDSVGSPGKAVALNMLDDDWKMKLSLQLISNSLLKERLMNTMPFAYKNN